nr:hypothetical protein [Bradyrhizobium sp. Bra78]
MLEEAMIQSLKQQPQIMRDGHTADAAEQASLRRRGNDRRV